MKKGFSLIEVMIALAILALSLLILYTGIGNSLRASGMAEEVTVATGLARQKMAEIMMALDVDIARGAFPDEKEENGVFEKPFEHYRWIYQIRKVELPVLNLPNDPLGASDEPKTSPETAAGSTQTTAGLEGAAENVAQAVTKKISEGIREVKLKISWGEEGEGGDQIQIVTHLVKLR